MLQRTLSTLRAIKTADSAAPGLGRAKFDDTVAERKVCPFCCFLCAMLHVGVITSHRRTNPHSPLHFTTSPHRLSSSRADLPGLEALSSAAPTPRKDTAGVAGLLCGEPSSLAA